ncbi:hypothetical protein AC369_24925 [Salmonella enterica subsp. diarizonae]|uniref:Uncharacterized protein n=1 Tax=Salmonella diarizonae TaxID=59204 RepID=A0A5Y1YCW4_SALDZ|nr:hypothetical protein [Salmonella enterica]EAW1261338.1 hypothetical protein [Salmonella enterica subsp. diarizonae]EAM8780552.1 hypothetical protein [Salmonella enterica]EAU6194744.1 hypothetical protein [Salmonella enterica]EBF4785660.1 hypothetical protein [Salmonella enterica subsp. diarizonae]
MEDGEKVVDCRTKSEVNMRGRLHFTFLVLRLLCDLTPALAGRFASQNSKFPPVQLSDEQLKVYSFEYYI